MTPQIKIQLRRTSINLRNEPTGTSRSAKFCSKILQWSLGTDQLNNSLTEIDLGIILVAKLNMSQKSALTANRESQEECNQRKLNAGEIAAQVLCPISSPPRLRRNLRTRKESPKWPGALRMMFEKQVMELSLFSLTKRQPRDNLIATEAEGTLQKQWRQTLLIIDQPQNKRQQPQVMAWEVQTGY